MGVADLHPHLLNPVVLKILPYYHILIFIDFSCMAIRVLLQKTTASYLPRFNFGGPSLDEKSDFQIANFQHFRNFASIDDFSKKIHGYNF